ncbi:hypothetical protein DL770_008176 [Monosporascus sp. CRB-9-2]|nr:hypothetical protein DL770_008176 [Monosporascus sp. CRB-9-2]
MNQITKKKSPLLTPLIFLAIQASVIRSLPRVLSLNSKEVQARIERRGKIEPLDHFEQLCPEDGVGPTDKKRRAHLEQVAGQLMLAGFDPIANQFYSTIYFLTQKPQVFSLLKEVRDTFRNYNDINPDGLAPLKFLHVCLQETMRLHINASFGMPRISPGAKVDGIYVPKGEPRRYQSQRWLPSTHTHGDEAFRHGHLKGLWLFSRSPRMCPGRESAWVQTKLFIAKVVWGFDLEMVPGQDYDWRRDMEHYSM